MFPIDQYKEIEFFIVYRNSLLPRKKETAKKYYYCSFMTGLESLSIRKESRRQE